MRSGLGGRWRAFVGGAIACAAFAGVAGVARGAAADGAPPLFGFGPQGVGFSIGYGDGASITSTGRFEGKLVQELVLVGHWRVALNREPIRPAFYKGVLSLRIEPFLIVNFAPRTGVAGGGTAMLRYEITRWGRTRPYLEGGAGILGLSLDLFDQADGLAFDPTLGVGLLHRVAERWDLDLSVRFQHISNAFTRVPNGGIEAFQYAVGFSYRL